jgi:hypothetical protein
MENSMCSSSKSIAKNALVKMLSIPARFVLKSAGHFEFTRPFINDQPWLIKERTEELNRAKQQLEAQFLLKEKQIGEELTQKIIVGLGESYRQRIIDPYASRTQNPGVSGGERVKYVEASKLVSTMQESLLPACEILDIGCGIVPQFYLIPTVHICCEPFEQYLDVLRKKVMDKPDRIYTFLNIGWEQAVELFPEKSVDTIFICDVIEHLEKEEGRRLLEKTVPIARKQVVIFTPLGFMPQHHTDGKDAWGLDGASWQEHKSGWEPEDFDERWQFVVSREYHTHDNLGSLLEKPFGAFWAICNNNG